MNKKKLKDITLKEMQEYCKKTHFCHNCIFYKSYVCSGCNLDIANLEKEVVL